MSATQKNRLVSILVVIGLVLFPATQLIAQKTAELVAAVMKPADRLKPFNSMIGEWKGVGQPKRGSSRGAWTEAVTCEWVFGDQQSTINFLASGGKQFSRLVLSWNQDHGQLQLKELTDGSERVYLGDMPDSWPGRVVLNTVADADGITYRCTIQQLSEIRATLLFEVQSSPTGSFRRVTGIGYTRSGEKLAEAGGNQRKCIVTGGLGTIAVSHEGKTYYVCCQGCVQAFNDAPDEIIADYQASLKRSE